MKSQKREKINEWLRWGQNEEHEGKGGRESKSFLL
jgi:hypothetical protein